jgi:hypothetical protein
MARNDGTRHKGASLAKGPVGVVGVLCLALGILGLIFGSLNFTAHPMNGTVNGGKFLGIEGNGWTWLGFGVAGVLLLLASPTHWGAKSIALLVGLAFGAAAVIAIIDGTDVFGIIATNTATKVVLAVGAVVLVVLARLPRLGHRRGDGRRDRDAAAADGGAAAAPNAAAGTVSNVIFLGSVVRYSVAAGAREILVEVPTAEGSSAFVPGDRVSLRWDASSCVVVGED